MSPHIPLLHPLVQMIRRRRELSAARRNLRYLIQRDDDRLIEDIGLTRQELRNILEQWDK